MKKSSRTVAVLMLVLAMAVTGCPGSDDDDEEVMSFLAIAGTDYMLARQAVTVMDEDNSITVTRNGDTIDWDVSGLSVSDRSQATLAYTVGRDQSRIYVSDPLAGMDILHSFTVGAPGWDGESPQDIQVVAEGKAYVTRYKSDDILIVDPRDGTRKGSISLVGIATNADGLARPADMILVNGKVFVALQNLDAGFDYMDDSIEPGIVAVIDPATDTIMTTVTLAGSNPWRLRYVRALDAIVIASAGNFAGASGLALFAMPDPDVASSALEIMTARPPYMTGTIITGDNPAIDGNIYDVDVLGGKAYILVAYGFYNEDRALKVDLATGAVDPGFRYPVTAGSSDDLAGVIVHRGFLFIGDRANTGLYIRDLTANSEVGLKSLNAPPMVMDVIETEVD